MAVDVENTNESGAGNRSHAIDTINLGGGGTIGLRAGPGTILVGSALPSLMVPATLSLTAGIGSGAILFPGTASAPGTSNAGNLTLAQNALVNFRPSVLSTRATATASIVYAPNQVGLALPNAGRVVQYWDGADTGAGIQGGSGTWNAANTNWTDVSGNANGPWAGQVGVFQGTAGTVRVEGAQSAQGMQFLVDGYRIEAGGNGSLVLAGDSAGNTNASFVNVDNGVTATISAPLTGSKGLDKLGTGVLVLNGANVYTGGTTVSAGTLALAGGGAIADTGTVNVGGSGTLRIDANETIGALTSAGTVGGTATLTATTYDFSGGTVDANLGTGTLNQIANTTTLNGTASAATVNVTGGMLQLGSANRLASGAALSVGGGSLNLGGFAQSVGAVTLTSGSIDNGTLTGSSYSVQSGSIGASLAGAAALTKTTNGTVTLSGANAYTGPTQINNGTLALVGAGSVASSSSLQLTSSNARFDISGIDALGTSVRAIVGNPGSAIELGAKTLTVALGGGLNFSGDIRGTGGLIKTGTGNQSLSGNSSYSGITLIAQGVLTARSATALGSTDGGTTVTNGASLYLGGFFPSIAVGNEALTLNGSGVVSGGSVVGALRNVGGANSYAGTITLASDSRINSDVGTSLTITGVVGGSGQSLTIGGAGTTAISSVIGTGSGSVTKDGTGTLLLSAANTYTGATTVSAGTLALAGGAAIADTGAVNVGGSGTLRIDANETIGALTSAGTIGGTATLTATTYDFSGGTVGANLGTGTLNQNAGTTTLNSTAGAATVNVAGGTLQLGSANRLASGAALSVGGGSFNLGGFAQSVGAVTLTGGSIDNGTLTGSSYSVQSGSVGASLAGAAALTKTTNGTVTLSGANSYTGATTVNAGTLALSGAGAVAASSGVSLAASGTAFDVSAISSSTSIQALAGMAGSSLALGSKTLAVAGGNFAGGFTGSGSLTKTGSGTFALTGDSSGFSGSATVAGGTLAVDGKLGGTTTVSGGATLSGSGGTLGAVSIGSGGILSPGAAGAPGTLHLGSLTLASGSIVNYQLGAANAPGDPANDLVNVSGDLTLAGATLNVTNAAPTGVYRVFNYGGTLTGNELAVGSTPTAGANLFYSPGQVNLLLSNSGQTIQFWDGPDSTGSVPGVNGGSGTWSAVNTNWTDATGLTHGAWAAQVGVFGTQGGTVTVAGTQSVQGLQFTVDGYHVVAGAGGSLSLTGDVLNTAASFVNVDSGKTAAIAAPLVGAKGLDKMGGGTLVFSGDNSYAGTTTVAAGVLNIRAATALGSTAGGTTVASGAALELEGGIAVGAEALTLNGSGLNNAGALRNVSGNNSYAGAITLTSDSRIATDLGALTLSGGLGGAGRNLTVGGVGPTTIAGAIATGSGGLTKDGLGTLTLAGANSYLGDTTIQSGIVVLNGGAAIADSGAVKLAAGAQLQLAADETIGSLTSAGTIGGAATLTATTYDFGGGTVDASLGTGTLNQNAGSTLLNGSAAAGSVNVNGGSLMLGAAQRLANGATLAVNGGTLDLGGYAQTLGAVTLASGSIEHGTLTGTGYAVQSGRVGAVLAGGGELVKSGAGTVTLAGANSYSGATRIDAGTLALSDAGSVAASSGVALTAAGASFDVSAIAAATAVQRLDGVAGSTVALGGKALAIDSGSFAGSFTGSGSLSKSGGATFTVSGDSAAFAGSSTVAAGTLRVDGALGGDLTVQAGARLQGIGQLGGASSTTRVAGTIAPGNSIGTLTIRGDYVQTGTYEVEYRAPTPGTAPVAGVDNDLLAIGGRATLTGGSLLLAPLSSQAQFDAARTAANNPTPGQLRYLILRADGGLGGTRYVALSNSAAVGIEYPNANDVELVLGGGSGPTVITNQPPAPLLQQAQTLRASGVGQASGLFDLSGDCDRFVSDNAVRDSEWCGFVQGARGRTKADNGSALGDQEAPWGTLYAGVLRRVDERTWVGLGLGYGSGDWSFSQSSAAGNFSWTQGALLARGGWQNLEWRALAGYAWGDADGTRSSQLPDGGRLTQHQNAQQASLGAEGRWWFGQRNDAAIAPYLGLLAARQWQNGYGESSASADAFRAEDATVNSLRGTLGLIGEWGLRLGDKPIVIEPRLAWQHEFADTTVTLSGRYAGDASGTLLSGEAPQAQRNATLFGLTAVAPLGKDFTARLQYNLSVNSQVTSQSLFLRFTAQW